MFASNHNLKNAAVKVTLMVCGLFVAASGLGCDTTSLVNGLGAGNNSLFDPTSIIQSVIGNRQQAVHIGRQVDARHFWAFIDH